jgi:hypothetical protein
LGSCSHLNEVGREQRVKGKEMLSCPWSSALSPTPHPPD